VPGQALRLAYLGPPGTFSEEALAAATGGEGEPLPFATIREAVVAVEREVADRALVPIENAIEGAVDATLDALADAAPRTRIVGEVVHPIRTCLVAARDDLPLDAVALVLSHPQPLGQCAGFLREVLPQAALRGATSTSEAVREVAGAPGEPWAALAPAGAAERYGCAVLRAGIDDDPDNRTRFVWLARAGAPRAAAAAGDGAAWRTSVLFAGRGDQTPGWLVRCLSEFAFRGVNLTRIESRPLRATLGHYRFFVDAQGRAAPGEPVSEAVAALTAHCDDVRVLGSYPAAAGVSGA
jgi:prephenate dehydratase